MNGDKVIIFNKPWSCSLEEYFKENLTPHEIFRRTGWI